MTRAQDLTGLTFGSWTVVRRVENNRHGNTQWLCRCVCEIEKIVRGTRLRSSRSSNACYDCAVKTGHGEIPGIYWNKVQYGASRRDLIFSIVIQDAWQLFLDQDRRCAISNLPIQFAPNKKTQASQTASLDRIDSTQGYLAGNVQWVHKDINRMKSDLTEDRFIELCKAVASW